MREDELHLKEYFETEKQITTILYKTLEKAQTILGKTEMKENKFQKQVIKQLESQTALILNLHGHLMQKSGWPDLQIIHRRWKGFLELKCEEYEASTLQRTVAARIELRGTPIYVLRCVERGKHDMTLDFKIKYFYTLENFQNNVITEFYDLKELLNILCKLESNK